MPKKNHIKIISAKLIHAKHLAELHVRSFKKAYQNIVPKKALNSFTIEARTKSFVEGITNKTENTYVCMLGNTIVGVLTLDKCRDTDIDNASEIWGIYLDPSYWRRGIGSKLAKWAIDYLVKSGFKKITLWVFKDNSPSRKFYESLGFMHDGKEKLIESCNAKAIRYVKNIS